MFYTGQRITYTYTHSLNARSKITVKKLGVFCRYVGNGKAVVRLDGNKTGSYVNVNSISK